MTLRTSLLLAASSFCAFSNLALAMSQTPAQPPAPQPEPDITDIVKEIELASVTPMHDLSAHQNEWSQPDSEIALWQGLDHEWLRFIVAPKDGRIPHRISSLTNFLEKNESGQLTTTFAQDTGVDGNYMHPRTSVVTLSDSGVQQQNGSVTVRWTDQLVDTAIEAKIPLQQARNKIRKIIRLPAALSAAEQQTPELALQGLDLTLHCDDADQPVGTPCNSDGMWPYLFALQLGQCEVSAGDYLCPLDINIYRSWTPNQGGVPGIGETKPLNYRLQYQLDVHISALSGDKNDVHFSAPQRLQKSDDLLNADSVASPLSITGQPGFSQGIALIKSFAFMLTRPEKVGGQWLGFNSDVNQRGRYLAKLQFALNDSDYDAATGTIRLTPDMHVWAPETVVDSRVHTLMEFQLMQLRSGKDRATHETEGRICLNSKAGAPFYSHWKNCDRQSKAAIEKFGGVERARDRITIGGGQ